MRPNQLIMNAVIGVTIAGALGWYANATIHALIEAPRMEQPPHMRSGMYLPPCLTDGDEQDCYWLADEMGNGQGVNFINFQGGIYYK